MDGYDPGPCVDVVRAAKGMISETAVQPIMDSKLRRIKGLPLAGPLRVMEVGILGSVSGLILTTTLARAI